MKMIDIVCIMSALSLSSCTISFQNISTHGTATDLVDETQAPQNDLKAEAHIPSF